jgi:hypothetical protein
VPPLPDGSDGRPGRARRIAAALRSATGRGPRSSALLRSPSEEDGGAGEQAVGEQAVGEQAVGEQAVSEQAVSEQAVSEQAVSEQAVSEQAVSEQAVDEQAIGAVHEEAPVRAPDAVASALDDAVGEQAAEPAPAIAAEEAAARIDAARARLRATIAAPADDEVAPGPPAEPG